jgi:hypothetical protein
MPGAMEPEASAWISPSLVNINNSKPSGRDHLVERLGFSVVLSSTACMNGTMDYSQSVFRLHRSEGLGAAVQSNVSWLSSSHSDQTFQSSYTTGQNTLLFIPSVILLLLFPTRACQLRRASLKVLPNYTGAIKAVGRSKESGWMDLLTLLAGAHCKHRCSRTGCSDPLLIIFSAPGWTVNCRQCRLLPGCSCILPLILL